MSSPAVSHRCLLVLALSAASLSGCAVPIAFNAVGGPLAAQRPPPSYVSQIRDAIFGGGPQGHLAVALEKGEIFRGTWRPAGTVPGAAARAEPDLTRDWDAVYGAGYFSAHVRGSRLRARAALMGSAGTTAAVEVYNEHDVCGETRGVARDSHNNLYRVTVYSDCGQFLVKVLSNGPPVQQRPEPPGPRLVMFSSGGPPVLAVPVGGGLYEPVTGGPAQPGTPAD